MLNDQRRHGGPGQPGPGIYALDAGTGRVLWSHRREPRCVERYCSPGISAAVSVNGGLVFSGSLDGFLEALDIESGDLLWRFDAWRDFDAVNGVETAGGAFDAHGPMLVGDLLIASSGYASFQEAGDWWRRPWTGWSR